ncbi:MAG: GNAT family N-acetyltransferase [Candidatus Riflebacteria bacterium]|nr:GNAT family N-acetyltransferase [Candidatus Riflebacteria bacterium]
MTVVPAASPPVLISGPALGQGFQCAPILWALPAWFGIPSATARYVADIDVLPTWTALHQGDHCVGFLTIRRHFPTAAEVHVMGVRPEHHHQGVGRGLLAAVEEHLRHEGVEFLQVKTLSPARPDANYEKTRAFYLAQGFQPLEEFPTLWGPANPCLQMVKDLRPAG